jgi:hypothetical protein
MKNCKKCGKEFNPIKKQQYCSIECRTKVRNEKRKKRPIIFNCLICGNEFLQKRRDNLVCSSLCGRKLWVKNNPDKSDSCDRGVNRKKRFIKWRENNRDKIRATKQRYKSKRRLKDIKFKLNELIGNSVRSSIKDKGFKKWSLILGYDIDVLKNHLEKTLPKNISWDIYLKNSTEFHIDHIIPISAYSFDSYNDEDFKKCWNYRNLRIISRSDNLIKFNSIEKELIKKYNIEDLLPKDFILL